MNFKIYNSAWAGVVQYQFYNSRLGKYWEFAGGLLSAGAWGTGAVRADTLSSEVSVSSIDSSYVLPIPTALYALRLDDRYVDVLIYGDGDAANNKDGVLKYSGVLDLMTGDVFDNTTRSKIGAVNIFGF